LTGEITWEILQQESGYPYVVEEMTTVTKRLRRIGRFDWDLARTAVQFNRPTRIAVNGLDYLSYSDRAVKDTAHLSGKSRAFLQQLSTMSGGAELYAGTGPALENVFFEPETGAFNSREGKLITV
jgi:adenylosuccinate synthase